MHDHFGKMLSFSSQTKNSELVFFHTGEPNHPEATYQYRKDFGTLLDASAKNGEISVTHRRSIMTLLHSAWEDRYRKMIANEIGLKCKNCLKSDVFQDVNIYRQAVIHAGGKLGKEPKVFRFFGKGEEVSLTSDHIVLIFRRVVDELNRIGRNCYHTDPQFRFDWPLNPKRAERPESIKPE